MAAALPPLANDRLALEDMLRLAGSAADGGIDLARTALALGALDRPEVGLARYEAHLDAIAQAVAHQARGATTPDERAAALAQAMAVELAYHGDALTYDDPQNANLLRVIDRRKGLPVALGILYLHAARTQGWVADGLTFPGHFLIRLEQDGQRVVLDPFHDGRRLSSAEMRALLQRMGAGRDLRPADYEVAGNRAILLRLQNNIVSRAVQARKFERAAAVLQAMLLFAPGHGEGWRQLGRIAAQCDNLVEARRATERFVELTTEAAARHEALVFLQHLRQKLN